MTTTGSRDTSRAPRRVTRREFMRASAAATLGTIAAERLEPARAAHAAGSDGLRVGVIGCGGRGTGGAANALDAAHGSRIVALADVFRDRIDECRAHLAPYGERADVAAGRCYTGFDAYQELLDSGVDCVILATPPHFRPAHLEAAVGAGCHVFMEKPAAVDPAGVRRVLAAADTADRKGLSIVAGTQRRHQASYLAAMERLRAGAIGPVVSARCAWNQGGLWMKGPRPEWSSMEWQVRNWLYFTWLSGDHIVEQHVHNLDVVNWALGSHPLRALGMGGRQVRTHSDYGNVFDHFAVEYEYPGGVFVSSMCRQIDGCAPRVEESFHGALGSMVTRHGHAAIEGAQPWSFQGAADDPYLQEHVDLVRSITEGPRLNEARSVADSTLTAIMGRMSAYTGQPVSWEQALGSALDLSPPAYEWSDLPVAPVAVPGRTPLT